MTKKIDWGIRHKGNYKRLVNFKVLYPPEFIIRINPTKSSSLISWLTKIVLIEIIRSESNPQPKAIFNKNLINLILIYNPNHSKPLRFKMNWSTKVWLAYEAWNMLLSNLINIMFLSLQTSDIICGILHLINQRTNFLISWWVLFMKLNLKKLFSILRHSVRHSLRSKKNIFKSSYCSQKGSLNETEN